MAWEPDPNKVADQEYANDELNSLMKKYRENEEHRDQYYTEQKRTRVAAASTTSASKEKPISISVVHDVPEGASDADTTAEASADAPSSLTASEPTLEGTPFGGAKVGTYDAMFDGPADLAIARKQAKQP
jgi:hypothetical protein